MNHTTTIDSLRRRLGEPLPGEVAHARMVPATRKTIYKDIEIPGNAKKSAVLILLYPHEGELYFPLIVRTEYPGVHSKQIGLPGGSWEEGDEDFVATALRETEEEVGVSRHQIEVLGKMSPLYIPPSNFWVQPVIGFLPQRPMFVPDPNEVESVFEVSLEELVGGSLLGESKIQHSTGLHLTVPSYTIAGNVVWGATAMMLSELILLIDNGELEISNENL